MSKGILYDATLCIDCKMCEKACAEQHGLPYDEAIAAEEKQSAHKLTVVMDHGEKYMRRLCMNCLDPTCASVCPVGALRKTAEGPVTYEASRCIGCRYCMLACPFSVPKYEWNKALPLVRKCDMCAERLAKGEPTACAAACPTGATKFGDRDALIAEAQDRIAKNPEQYVHHIYGVSEVGGTSVLLLSSVPFEGFGYPANLSGQPLPVLTWHVLSELPQVVTFGAALLGGIWWITHRREAVAAAEAKSGD
ncbi:MAG TPA: 4Fe-4S dicluster domain-containing protein [Patescibacteria group bacterium]|nr:4Fe-4S dicluster domain-containing protein [Patescibacteria group bacterium]